MVKTIGRGAFGEVWLANAQGIVEFKTENSNLSPVKVKKMSRIFSFSSNYQNFEQLKLARCTNVAVKTLKGKRKSNCIDVHLRALCTMVCNMSAMKKFQHLPNTLEFIKAVSDTALDIINAASRDGNFDSRCAHAQVSLWDG